MVGRFLPERRFTRKARSRHPDGQRPSSKTAEVLALLKRPQGVGLKELLKVTNWQPHTVLWIPQGSGDHEDGPDGPLVHDRIRRATLCS